MLIKLTRKEITMIRVAMLQALSRTKDLHPELYDEKRKAYLPLFQKLADMRTALEASDVD